ncbi:The fantastic four family [Sesbania bispinosa]|nr:The fantastic four family [Sesbania bispinosa]
MLSKSKYYLSRKVKYITSSIYRYTLSLASKLHFPFPLKNNPKKQYRPGNGYCYGLKNLFPPPSRILHCYNIASKSKPFPPPSSKPPSSPAFRTTMMGEVIGTESGDCMNCDAVEDVKGKAEKSPAIATSQRRGREYRSGRTKREFPAPITLMRETGRMPWIFRREYSEDGRIVIRAEREKVKRHEYVEAYRENGRLTMRLVEEDNGESVCCGKCGWPIPEEELEDLEFNEEPEGLERVGEDEEEEEVGFDSEEEFGKEGSESSLGRCGDLRQCVSYAAGELVRDSDSCWKGTGIGDANDYLGRPGSAPLRPMMPVM